jgi:transposase InsO family protein
MAKKIFKFGRYGYRRITHLLCRDGWRVNHKRVEWIWRVGRNLTSEDVQACLTE